MVSYTHPKLYFFHIKFFELKSLQFNKWCRFTVSLTLTLSFYSLVKSTAVPMCNCQWFHQFLSCYCVHDVKLISVQLHHMEWVMDWYWMLLHACMVWKWSNRKHDCSFFFFFSSWMFKLVFIFHAGLAAVELLATVWLIFEWSPSESLLSMCCLCFSFPGGCLQVTIQKLITWKMAAPSQAFTA